MSTSEVIATLINFAGLIFLGAQVMLARRALRGAAEGQQQEWDRQRRKASIDASIATAPYREKLKAVLPWNDRDPVAMAAFFRESKDDYAKLWPVREYLNHLEDMATGVKQGVFDLDTISMLEGGRLLDVVTSYAPYIKNIRQEIQRPTVYSDIEDLAELIREHRRRSVSIVDSGVQRMPSARNLRIQFRWGSFLFKRIGGSRR